MCVSLFVLLHNRGGASDHVITEEDAAALDLLISGCADNNGVCSVVSFATMPFELSKTGYCKMGI